MEAPEVVPAPDPTAHVGSAVVLEELTQVPGVPVPRAPIADVFTEAAIIRRVTPSYPQAAVAADLEGNVILSGVIGVDGKVSDITVVRSVHPLLDMAARKALAEYQFEPARRNGIPIPWPMRLEVPFTLK